MLDIVIMYKCIEYLNFSIEIMYLSPTECLPVHSAVTNNENTPKIREDDPIRMPTGLGITGLVIVIIF